MATYNGTGNDNDRWTGTASADTFNGNAGNDTMSGMAGNDTLNGGTGNDSMTGGAGNDTYYVDSLGDKVIETAGDSGDVVITTINLVQPLNVETMQLKANSDAVNGTGNYQDNTIVGNSADNYLWGMDGNDTLQGGGGADTLEGGLGADALTGGAGADTFMYWSYEASPGAFNQWDRVTDFGTGNDQIDVSQLDADLTDGSYLVGGPNQYEGEDVIPGPNGIYDDTPGFTWIGTDAFHANTPGEARYDPVTGLFSLSNDDDVEAEFSVFVGTGLTANYVRSHVIIEDLYGPTFIHAGEDPAHVLENVTGTIQVYDADTDDARTTFSIEGEDSDFFSINSITGVVTFHGPVDYEEYQELHYTIVATDHVGNHTYLDRTVEVQDANEFTPTFSETGEDSSSVCLDEGDSGLEASDTLTVTDGDINDQVSLSVESVNVSGPDGGLSNATLLGFLSVNDDPIDADVGDARNVTWSFDSGSEAFDFLASGETLTLTYTIKATDDNPYPSVRSSTDEITVTIKGTNDAPEITCGPSIDASGIRFTAFDPDNGASLSFDEPFSGSVNNDSETTFTATVQAEVVTGDMVVVDEHGATAYLDLFVGLGTSGNDTIYTNGYESAVWGFGGNDKLYGGEDDDVLVGGAGRDLVSGGDGSDTFYVSAGDYVLGEQIYGGAGEDTIVMADAGTLELDIGLVSEVEMLEGSGGNDTLRLSAGQWADLDFIDMGSGSDTINVTVAVLADISASGATEIDGAETGNLVGSFLGDFVKLSGQQLDSIVFGGGTINLDSGLDTLSITSTSNVLNTIGSGNNAGLAGVDIITAEDAGSGVTIDLSAQNDALALTGSAYADTLTGTTGSDAIRGGKGGDLLVGNGGNDTFWFKAGDSALSIGGSGSAGTINGYDSVVGGFSLGGTILAGSNDVIAFENGLTGASKASSGSRNGTDSDLLVDGNKVMSHSITSGGLVTFDDQDTYAAGLTLDSMEDVAAVVQYLQKNDIGSTGDTVVFNATISAVTHSFVYIQGTNSGSPDSNDVLIDLVGVSANGLFTSLIGSAGATQISLL